MLMLWNEFDSINIRSLFRDCRCLDLAIQGCFIVFQNILPIVQNSLPILNITQTSQFLSDFVMLSGQCC